VNKRTIKPAAGHSRITPAAARAAARNVRRTKTGKFVISKKQNAAQTSKSR
jgi:hypothetical protein